jgi:ribonuclease Z
VEVTFLGTGSAFSPVAYNACVLVDRSVLLDAGAPLCVHLPKVGVPISAPRATLLTHFHADHTFGLACLLLGRALGTEPSPPFEIFGPAGTDDYLRRLLDLAWGEEMRKLSWERLQLSVREVKPDRPFEVDGFKASAFQMTHTARFPCLGFVLEKDGLRLGYTGDAEKSPGLEELLGSCDHVITEMTYDKPGPMHLSREEVERLMHEFPRVRFIVTHHGSGGTLNGALAARDFLTLKLPLS